MRGVLLCAVALLNLLAAPVIDSSATQTEVGTWPALGYLGGNESPAVPVAPVPLGSTDATVPTRVTGSASDGLLVEVIYWPLWEHGQEEASDVRPFNLTLDVLQWTLDNYEEFLTWGFAPAGGDDKVTVWIDAPVTESQCVSGCALGNEIWVRATTPVIGLVWTTATEEEGFRRTLGHEMFHVVQQRTTENNRHKTYMEGTARMQETLHVYSEVSHQRRSVVYAEDKNGCNGYDAYTGGTDVTTGPAVTPEDMDLGMAIGPFTEAGQWVFNKYDIGPKHSYDTCYFWLAWYAHHGIDALVRLVERSEVAGTSWDERFTGAIEQATGVSIVEDYARFAQMSLTGRGYTWGPAAGPGPTLDWGEHLDRWNPATLIAGEEASVELQGGGMMARSLAAPGTVTWSGDNTVGYLVRDDGHDATLALAASGEQVEVEADETVWVIVIHPTAGETTATIALA